MNKEAKSKQKRTLIIALTAIIVVLVAALPPVLIPSGVEQYSGDMKKAAEVQLKMAPELKDGIDAPVLKYRVEKITETPTETAKSWCGPTYDPAKTYYSVTIGEYSLFGIKSAEYTRHDACILI